MGGKLTIFLKLRKVYFTTVRSKNLYSNDSWLNIVIIEHLICILFTNQKCFMLHLIHCITWNLGTLAWLIKVYELFNFVVQSIQAVNK